MALRPSPCSRLSPPVTRSSSRTSGLFRNPIDSSTPLTRKSIQPGMHIETVERNYERADDSVFDPNETQFDYSRQLSRGERMEIKTHIWYDRLAYYLPRAKNRLIPSLKTFREFFMVVVLAAMLCFYLRDNFKVESENPHSQFNIEAERHKFEQSVSAMTSEFRNFEHRMNSRLDQIENQLETMKGWHDPLFHELNTLKNTQMELTEELQNFKIELDEEKAARKEVVPEERDPPVQAAPPPAPTHPTSYSPAVFRRPLPGVNVANSLIGASIDETCSSRTASAKDGLFYDMMSYVVSFQEGYVLLDRDALSPGEAWCTYDRRPTLTVKLARFIHPTAVSYQHVRWNGIVPNHAPKLYDLVACRSPCCTKWEPLITNCSYKASEDGVDEQEQFCQVPATLHMNPVKHVQFRFRENHGNMTKTCAYLVRVYGEPVEVAPEPATDNVTSNRMEAELMNSMAKTA